MPETKTLGSKAAFRAHGARMDAFQLEWAKLNVREAGDARRNRRADFSGVEELAESIRALGIQKPLEVEWDTERQKFFIFDGERRYRAAMLLLEDGHDLQPKVKCFTAPQRKVPEALAAQLASNDGRPFTMLEQGDIFAGMKEADPELTNAEIARRCGRTRTHVGDCLRLAEAPEAARKAIVEGLMACKLVLNLIKQNPASPDEMESTIEAALANADARGKQKATARDLPKNEGDDTNRDGAPESGDSESPENSEEGEKEDGGLETEVTSTPDSARTEEEKAEHKKPYNPDTTGNTLGDRGPVTSGGGGRGTGESMPKLESRFKSFEKMLDDISEDGAKDESLYGLADAISSYLSGVGQIGEVKKLIKS